ncbi:uncharacterized protein LOC120346192 [Styela clava]
MRKVGICSAVALLLMLSVIVSLTSASKRKRCTDSSIYCQHFKMLCPTQKMQEICAKTCGCKSKILRDVGNIKVNKPKPEEFKEITSTNKRVDFHDEEENNTQQDHFDFDPYKQQADGAKLLQRTAEWTKWGQWSICSVTCGLGKRTRTRVCQSGTCPGSKVQSWACALTRTCIETRPWTKPCTDTRTDCTKSICNTRRRHSCKATCKECYKWGDYGALDKCHRYDGKCERRRYRHCRIGDCLGLPYKSKRCANEYCGNREMWSHWSSCSVTCGTGITKRTRLCETQGCKSTDERTCIRNSCDEPQKPDIKYGEWSRCSKTCGSGMRRKTCSTEYCKMNKVVELTQTCRIKECETCVDKHVYCPQLIRYCPNNEWMKRNCMLSCNMCKIEWSNWNKWSKCSKTCGSGGSRQRTRKCLINICTGSNTETVLCEKQNECPTIQEWSDWSDWTDCKQACGEKLFRTRNRECMKGQCAGKSTMTEPCPPVDCQAGKSEPIWKEWTEWGDCSKSCGGGKRSRTRECNIERKCDRKTERDVETCNQKSCHEKFTSCNLACGGGYRWAYKSSCTHNDVYKCNGYFQGCNYQDCNKKPCISPQKRRYGSTTCCNNQKVEMDCGRVQVREAQEKSLAFQEYISFGRIIKGMVSEPNAWPWMGMFMASISRKLYCAGTVIHQKWLLTAAHCVRDSGTNKDRPKSDMALYLGINKLSEIKKGNGRRIRSFKVHPSYHFPQFDIALLEVDEITFSATIYPACMPKGEEVGINQKCYVTGWGVFDTKKPMSSPKLREVGLRVLDEKVCKHAWNSGTTGAYVQRHYNKVICAGSVYEKNDTCGGDSGGPLICQRCSSCSWYVAGITSFGPRNCGTPGIPGVYTKVQHHENWVYKHIPDLKPTERKTCASYSDVQRKFTMEPNPAPVPHWSIFNQNPVNHVGNIPQIPARGYSTNNPVAIPRQLLFPFIPMPGFG